MICAGSVFGVIIGPMITLKAEQDVGRGTPAASLLPGASRLVTSEAALLVSEGIGVRERPGFHLTSPEILQPRLLSSPAGGRSLEAPGGIGQRLVGILSQSDEGFSH